MDTTEIQKDMGDKRVMDLKNIQKVIKEAELNGGRIKKQKPKQRKYSTLKICTYDMESCDTTMEHKKKEDTTIYVRGSTKETNTKRYTRRIMIMSLQSSFISWKHATNPYCSTLAVVTNSTLSCS